MTSTVLTGSCEGPAWRLCMVSLLLAALDGTLAITLLPAMGQQLTGELHASWIVSGFMLAHAFATPLFGNAADRHGVSAPFTWAMCLFIAGSALVSTATCMGAAIVGRVLQGLGSGGIQVLIYTLLGTHPGSRTTARRLGHASAVWGVAAILGPVVGTALSAGHAWRWAFAINIPLGILIMWGLRGRWPTHSLGAAGGGRPTGNLLLLSLGMVFTLVALTPGPDTSLRWTFGAWGIALGSLAAVTLLRALPGSTPSLAASLAATAVLYGGLTFVPLFLQGSAGTTRFQGGVAVFAGSMGWVMGSLATARILGRLGTRSTALLGSLLMASACLGLGHGALLRHPGQVQMFTAILGLGMGAVAFASLLSAQAAVPNACQGAVTGLIHLSRSLGGALGVGLAGSMMPAAERMSDNAAFAVGFFTLAPAALMASLAALHLHPIPRPVVPQEVS